MDIKSAIKKIDRYLRKGNVNVLIVNVQNKKDLDAIVTHYNIPQNTFIYASDYGFCNPDEFPSVANLFNRLTKENSNLFVQEITSFYMLKGEKALTEILQELLALNIIGHVVIITYMCESFLKNIIKSDRRLESRVCLIDGDISCRPRFIFAMKGIRKQDDENIVYGINRIAKAVESEVSDVIYVETDKSKSNYEYSLLPISDMKSPYEVLCSYDSMTSSLTEDVGNEEDWMNVLHEFEKYSSWRQLFSAKIGDVQHLDIAISNFRLHKSDKQWLWLYYISLKLFGGGDNWCLNTAMKNTTNSAELVKNIYRSILELEPTSDLFNKAYEQRKIILSALDNPVEDVVDFCKIVMSKEKDAIYYLTDNSIQEKELVFKMLDKYGQEFEKEELIDILKRVYPALYHYLSPYKFKNKLLDTYFQEYKYQKVINKIFPEFMAVVEQQAIDREYNRLLPPRSSLVESLNLNKTQVYFIDAMGVEYLSFIMFKCHELDLMAKVSVCRCELPSITSRNKEFWDSLSSEEYPIITFDKLDKIKHHGEEGYDYSREDKKIPIHLIRELELIDGLLNKIKVNLASGHYKKAILISDHGASRLAVIHETENLVEMSSNGNHSGRCCPKSDVDIQPDYATDANDFWALANYDRFKGSRRANVEVHGGATLEEVAVPIIELTYIQSSIEVKIMAVDAPASFAGTPEIKVSYRKKAAIKIFTTQKLSDVSIEISGHEYEAKPLGDNFYEVEEMPEIRRAGTYNVNVYSCGNEIATGLPLIVKKESAIENDIL